MKKSKKQCQNWKCYAILHKGELVKVLLAYPEDVQSALGWAWASHTRKTYSAGIALPYAYRRAKACGYTIIPVIVYSYAAMGLKRFEKLELK